MFITFAQYILPLIIISIWGAVILNNARQNGRAIKQGALPAETRLIPRADLVALGFIATSLLLNAAVGLSTWRQGALPV